MKTLFASILFCLHAPLLFTAESSALSSAQASYDGNALVLNGDVKLDHGLGKMQADEAWLEKQDNGKESPFSSIQLKTDVKLVMRLNAELLCDRAHLDFNKLKGELHRGVQEQVIYTDLVPKKKGGELAPLRLKGDQVDLYFNKTHSESKKTQYDIETLVAERAVSIEYLEQFLLLADRAIYRKQSSPSLGIGHKKEFQGVITAYPEHPQSPCTLIHQGHSICAEMIDIDLLHCKLSLLHPRGTLSLFSGTQDPPLSFQSDYLYWDYNKRLLTLQGQIEIQEEGLGTLHTQEEVQLTFASTGSKTTVCSILTQGASQLLSSKGNHTLKTEGPIRIDRNALKGFIDGASQEHPQAQLSYQTEQLCLLADHATIDYTLQGETLEPSKLSLNGNIRLTSVQNTPSLKKQMCGCADLLDYFPDTHTIVLQANPGNKVLFWDKGQGMHLSAPEVHIVIDPLTGEQQVKGIGTVQFTFTAEEQHKLQQLFPEMTQTL